jgi:hypothetical protein
MTGAEIADATGEIITQLATDLPLAVLSGGYYSSVTDEDYRFRQAFEQQDRREVEQLIWSLTPGLPSEGLATLLPAPDVQYTWPKTGTTVIAYRLGLPCHLFVGVIAGRVAWIHAGYPGLIMQAKLAAQQADLTRRVPTGSH